MNSREQTLSVILLGAIALTVAGGGGYFFIWQPLQRQNTAMQTLTQEIGELERQVDAQAATKKKLDVARVRSLPADESLAKREYTVALERIIESAGIPKGYKITHKTVETRSIPELSKGKPIYTKIACEVILDKVDMWMLKDFLEGYYRLGLLHQITNFVIKKDDDNTGKGANRRNDLTVTFTTEAIIVDGADNRQTLLPVPTAYAAIGGGAMYKGISATPETGRSINPHPLVPVLASKGRDYSLLVRKDPFHGPWIDPPKSDLKIKVAQADVKIKTDEKPDAPRITVSGEGSVGAKVTAIASGSLFPEGALKVELRTTGLYSIELPTTSATEGTATVSVIATSADGSKTEKASFKVSLEEKPVDLGESLSGVILLVGITSRSDGTAWARIMDNANRRRYQIDAGPKGITVVKEYTRGPDRPWITDDEHTKLPGLMELQETTTIKRTFKLIAVTAEGLILADIKPGSVPKAGGKGGPPRPAKQPASPLAALGGNMIAAAPTPKYYRWAVGQSLANIKPIPPDEVKLILKTAEATGPVFDVADAR